MRLARALLGALRAAAALCHVACGERSARGVDVEQRREACVGGGRDEGAGLVEARALGGRRAGDEREARAIERDLCAQAGLAGAGCLGGCHLVGRLRLGPPALEPGHVRERGVGLRHPCASPGGRAHQIGQIGAPDQLEDPGHHVGHAAEHGGQ